MIDGFFIIDLEKSEEKTENDLFIVVLNKCFVSYFQIFFHLFVWTEK